MKKKYQKMVVSVIALLLVALMVLGFVAMVFTA